MDRRTARLVGDVDDPVFGALERPANEHLEGNPMTTTAAPDFVAAVYIRATPEAIWRAITETDFTLRYYYGSAIETDWQVSGGWPFILSGLKSVLETGKGLGEG